MAGAYGLPSTQTPRPVIVNHPPLGDRLMVGQQTLTLFIVVRVHVPQPQKRCRFHEVCP
jgi:hypothetical protein